MTSDSEKSSANIAGVAFVAAVIGAAAAMLLAPKSGSETRDHIKRKMNEAKEKSKQKKEEMKGKARSKVEDATNEALNRTEETANKAQDEARRRRNQ